MDGARLSAGLSGVVIKKSALALLRDPATSNWEKKFFALRRPYLYVYSSSSETDIETVINVETVRVETSPEMVQMTGRKHVWAIYTPQVRLTSKRYWR
jgi:kinesin family protein 1